MLIVSNTIFAHLHSRLQSIKNECGWKFKICIFNKYSNSNAKKIGKSHDWKMATANIEIMFGIEIITFKLLIHQMIHLTTNGLMVYIFQIIY